MQVIVVSGWTADHAVVGSQVRSGMRTDRLSHRRPPTPLIGLKRTGEATRG
jgi:hypothetical protein